MPDAMPEPGGISMSLVGSPPAKGMMAVFQLKLTASSGVRQATDFPSGETAGPPHWRSVNCDAAPPSIDTFIKIHLLSRSVWYSTHLLSLELAGQKANFSPLVSCF